MPIRLSESEFRDLVSQALAQLPEPFQEYLQNLAVEVHPQPSRKLMREMEIEDPAELLGVYLGVPLTEKSVDALVDWPEQILIFQRNIESICDTRADVIEQVRTTVLHEIGHHFGLDEDGLDELGYG